MIKRDFIERDRLLHVTFHLGCFHQGAHVLCRLPEMNMFRQERKLRHHTAIDAHDDEKENR